MIDNFGVIDALSLNLPRLSYESNKDETYFRAKLAMLLQLSISALAKRREIIGEAIDRGLLPLLAQNPSILSSEHMPAIINLVGLNEAISNLIGEKAAQPDKKDLMEKVIGTASKFMDEKARKVGGEMELSILKSDGSERFYTLDIEKYGKSIVDTKGGKSAYSQIPCVQDADLNNESLIDELRLLSRSLTGGFSTIIDVPPNSRSDLIEKVISEAYSRLNFFKINKKISICKKCGAKFSVEVGRCKVCKSMALIYYFTS
jgi:ribonucleoside-triphosphate reductase